MISIYKIKPAFQKLLQPLMNGLYKIGVTPNAITVFSIVFSLGLGALVYYHPWNPSFLLLVTLGLFLRMVFNALDGMMAKQHNMQSKLGEVLNEIGDVLSDLFVILPFVIIPSIDPGWILLFAFLAVINEFAGVLGKALGGERRYEGPMGKSDRALFIGLFCIITYSWEGFSAYQNEAFIGAIGLILISTIVRLVKAVK
ncbi:MAG: CDP-alcohol phosphatidyltransferase family protein [Crocinitomicaceae bacterium]|nr:CDP-alcohol phosphatidyltransferase family protein [Crocinitomicaceae bacterium]